MIQYHRSNIDAWLMDRGMRDWNRVIVISRNGPDPRGSFVLVVRLSQPVSITIERDGVLMHGAFMADVDGGGAFFDYIMSKWHDEFNPDRSGVFSDRYLVFARDAAASRLVVFDTSATGVGAIHSRVVDLLSAIGVEVPIDGIDLPSSISATSQQSGGR